MFFGCKPGEGFTTSCCLMSINWYLKNLLPMSKYYDFHFSFIFLVCGGRGCSHVLTSEGPSGGSKLLSEYLCQWFFCLVNGVYCYRKTGWLDGIHLPTLQCWVCRYTVLAFTWVAGIWTRVLMLVQPELYPQNHFPSFSSLSFFILLPSDSYAHYYRCQKNQETSKLTPNKKSIFVKSKETTKGLGEAQEEYSDVLDFLIQTESFENLFQTSTEASVSLGSVLLSMMHREGWTCLPIGCSPK